ncbi:recombinase family protein [Aliarcobacter cryaerophilus]|jgi:DNA invertase Pin-like site-specific DNA recombinase|uniref:recombinase family protein n=1 Tax=Aliarcobacter cryaerophilus TaxID=28198 RepID=UPI00112F1941
MHVGYIRVSTDDQNLSLQKDALLKYGDTLVVWKLDRLGRSLAHLISVITDLKNRNVSFVYSYQCNKCYFDYITI